eukprot:TRINITY_DN1510_c0_g1::TRINITY_DN1510_c0_g1_i1::g.28127::m.28127 TRINITY_DN1510_c0_g1::TRINITY_DN1510_c0_g1_i1::g.28127  ORF type:complete len:912 (-),score=274.68,sp/Q91YR7/PRP6_MOUSE/55.58/0.0,PRP1_N/PF06424.7/1.7e-43,TPR_14/PF13428.1/84,TPR_14/PF13428.1/0.065,TPR_14/PF13428.1/1.3e+03,TPR_14/PF13428.1/1.7e+02,TPR_14/PF13428.1/0.031,TPR_14/PF13428.1/1.1,TPR_14/PF13428.1/35,TPR_14/PF13428.1/3.7,TPR_14/PF13428.1/0.0032,TPR_14/PF13428.1/26,TPR_14/PF13428.1/0.98,TPR_14/PF13428.1/1.4e-05,TPR_14/PF134
MSQFHTRIVKGEWNTRTAPPNYVAGLGRGATGFTTRSDIGPARIITTLNTEAPATAPTKPPDEEEKEEVTERGYDEFSGEFQSLFKNDPYEEDDKEADAIYASVDDRMDHRRKKQREEREKKELQEYLAKRPKLQAHFSDIKRQLGELSDTDWDAIPDIGDYTVKKRKLERFIPTPDSLLDKARQEQESAKSLEVFGGLETPVGTQTDLRQIGEARGTVLGLKLDKVSDSVSGQTNVDPKGYLTDLNSLNITSDTAVQDIKKARLLLKSITQTNPKHGPGWIAAARLEELAGKLAAAREIIRQGCEQAPDGEDVWLEAARLHPANLAKTILAQGVSRLPTSVKLWLQAAELETEVVRKKRVLRKALETIPNSVKLWKAAVTLEEADDARILLSRAVECCPHAVELWLALARLETYDNAKKVLNKARENNPSDVGIWITAAKLEEVQGNAPNVDRIITLAVKTLNKNNVLIDRDTWLKHAEECERSGSVLTCQAIVRATVGMGVEDVDRKQTWMHDGEQLLHNGSIETARAVYAHALTVFPGKKSIWLRAAHLEKQHGTPTSLDQLLRKAVTYCPKAEVLWLMAAKERWLQGDVPGARQILREAFSANPDSEQIWLAAVKLERENSEPERARLLLEKARARSSTEKVWLKSVCLERDLGNFPEEEKLLDQALKKFSAFDKLWMMRGQLEERRGNTTAAHEFYQQGLKKCPQSIPLWIMLARLEERNAAWGVMKARSTLEKARLRVPKAPLLWLEAVRFEKRAGLDKVAHSLMAMALQECSQSGQLWAEAIFMEPPPKRRIKSLDALKKCENDHWVLAAAAKLFWSDRKADKARNWFNRALNVNEDNGDTWAAFLKFEIQYGDEEKQKQVIERCVKADPRHGDLWPQVRKAPENWKLKTEEILRKVAAMITVS